MTLRRFHFLALLLAGAALPVSLTGQPINTRKFQPDDLFQIRRVGATAWASDGRHAAIQLGKPSLHLDDGYPSAKEIAVVDVTQRTLQTVSSNAAEYIGFFNPIWSPDGKKLAFLSVDNDAVVRLWTWSGGTGEPTVLPNLDVRIGSNDLPFAWLGDDRLAVLAWDTGAEKSGTFYFQILRGRNVAEGWKRALDARSPSVTVLDSGRAPASTPKSGRLAIFDLRANSEITVARGELHRVSVSPDRRFLAFLEEKPGLRAMPLLDPKTNLEDGFAAVNWGGTRHVVEVASGAEVDPSSASFAAAKSTAQAPPSSPAPRADARRLSASPSGDAALYLANASDGSHLWICGGPEKPLTSCGEIWRANEWVRDIKTGQAEQIAYTSSDGTALSACLLLPPGYVPNVRVPLITIVYPSTVYTTATPSAFSLYTSDFLHTQLFAALGSAVLLPSMPLPKDPALWHALDPLAYAVLPAIDAVIARGYADPDRLVLAGHSDGGFATLGLLTVSTRFRSAIASAGFSDLVSLYGTFYAQYRYGDAGRPEDAQILRMLFSEKGALGMGGPPWAEPARYRDDSAIFRAGKVETPVMLVQGDLDFVPIQQSEEFFTALYRQDKRATFIRYQGEAHSISSRANVLDLWRRIFAWLEETNAPRTPAR